MHGGVPGPHRLGPVRATDRSWVRFEDAFLVARSPNARWPRSVAGSAPLPCEDACRRGWIDEPVTIRPTQTFRHRELRRRVGATRTSYRVLTAPILRTQPTTVEIDPGCRRAVAHVTARPGHAAGKQTVTVPRSPSSAAVPRDSACAHDLASAGLTTSRCSRRCRSSGGMLRYGIPEYRLPRGRDRTRGGR